MYWRRWIRTRDTPDNADHGDLNTCHIPREGRGKGVSDLGRIRPHKVEREAAVGK